MALHIHKPTNKLNKSSKKIINTSIKKPKNEYVENPSKENVVKNYANIRADKKLVCEIRALGSLLGDKNVSVTLTKILNVSLPKYVKTDKQKSLFKAYKLMYDNKIK